MAIIPERIPTVPTSAIASYDWSDAISETGFVEFYLGKTASGDYIFSKQPFFSYPFDEFKEYNSDGNQLNFTTLTFELEFQTSTTLGGTALIQIPHVEAKGSTASTTFTAVDTCTLKKNDDTLVSDSGTITHSTNSVGNYNLINSVSLEIPLTRFSPGDILKLQVAGYFTLNEGAFGRPEGASIAYDPMSRTDGIDTEGDYGPVTYDISSTMKATIPFRIDI